MIRYTVLFVTLLILALALLAGVLSESGRDLFAPEMRWVLGATVLAAAYVSWRAGNVLKAQSKFQRGREAPGGAGKTKLSGFFAPRKSAAQIARETRIAARRQKLIAEGKLDPEPGPEPDALPRPGLPPTRVPQSAPLRDRMAARAERVRRAKEDGKI